jgi:nitroreductase
MITASNSRDVTLPATPDRQWIDAFSFAPTGTETAAELLTRAVAFGILAPSSHNTQPWSFRVRWDGLEILLDRSRVLPVADPAAREMIISCGAALQNIRIALRYWGFATRVELMPHASAPDVLARVKVGGRRLPSKLNDLLFAAIRERHTNRAPFLPLPVPARLIAALRSAAELEGAWFYQTTDARQRPMVAKLIAKGDRQQWIDGRFRREVTSWMRPNSGEHRDGLPGYVFGMSDLVARFAPGLLRRVPMGLTQARHDRELALDAPLLVALGTSGDTPRHWLEAGQALQLVLLVAAAHGVSASFLNQPLQVPALRARIRSQLGVSGYPQVILRMGYAPPTRATPRRGLDDVLDAQLLDAELADAAHVCAIPTTESAGDL